MAANIQGAGTSATTQGDEIAVRATSLASSSGRSREEQVGDSWAIMSKMTDAIASNDSKWSNNPAHTWMHLKASLLQQNMQKFENNFTAKRTFMVAVSDLSDTDTSSFSDFFSGAFDVAQILSDNGLGAQFVIQTTDAKGSVEINPTIIGMVLDESGLASK